MRKSWGIMLMLGLCLTVLALPVRAAEDRRIPYAVTGGNIYFDPATGTVTDCDYSVTEAVIPEKIGGVAVTSIGESAFQGCGELTAVSIPESVTRIGQDAFFGCSSLTSVTIPGGVSRIESRTFTGCASLAEIKLPGNATFIGSLAFSGCTALTSVTLPENMQNISASAFPGSGLKRVFLPASVIRMDGAFANCKDLTEVQVDPANRTYSSIDGLVFSKDQTTLLFCPQGKAGSYSVPPHVTGIESGAFRNCDRLTSIVIPENVTSIGSSAFSGCTGLTSASIPAGVTRLEYGLFENCTALTSVSFPEGMTGIGHYAFNGCTALTSVTLLEGITDIGSGAFRNCAALTSVTLPASLLSIGSSVFAYSGLKQVVYTGTEGQRHQIRVGEDNQELVLAPWTCTGTRGIRVGSAEMDGSSYCPRLTVRVENPVSGTEVYGAVYDQDGRLLTVEWMTLPGNGTATLRFYELETLPAGSIVKVLLCGQMTGQPLNSAFFVK